MWQITEIGSNSDGNPLYTIRSNLDSKCLIFGGNGNDVHPRRWRYNGNSNGVSEYCGFGDASTAISYGQVVWQISKIQEPKKLDLDFYFGTALPSSAESGALLDNGKSDQVKTVSGHRVAFGWDCDGVKGQDYSSGRRAPGRGSKGKGLNHFDRNNRCSGDVNWSVEVPNGDYVVEVDFGNGDDKSQTGFVEKSSLKKARARANANEGCKLMGRQVCPPTTKACVVEQLVSVTNGKITITGDAHDNGKCHSVSQVKITATKAYYMEETPKKYMAMSSKWSDRSTLPYFSGASAQSAASLGILATATQISPLQQDTGLAELLHGPFGKGQSLSTHFEVPASAKALQLTFKVWAVSSWDTGESVSCYADGKKIWSRPRQWFRDPASQGWTGVPVSDANLWHPWKGYRDSNGWHACDPCAAYDLVDVPVDVTPGSTGFKLECTSNANSPTPDEYWALSQVSVRDRA